MIGVEEGERGFCAFHVALPEPWEPFMVAVLRPFVAQERERGRLGRVFFVRMGEPRPHLRIRFCFGGDTCAAGAERWRAHHTARAHGPVQSERVRYEPETDRFGHGSDLERSEAFFDASSTAVLDAMAGAEGWDGRRARAVAVALHLGVAEAAAAAGVAPTELFRGYAGRWGKALEARVLSSARSAPAAATVGRLWRQLSDAHETEPWLCSWRREVARLVQNHTGAGVSPAPSGLQPWLHEQIHLTNNRLGIAWGDEPYLAALLACGLVDTRRRVRPEGSP